MTNQLAVYENFDNIKQSFARLKIYFFELIFTVQKKYDLNV